MYKRRHVPVYRDFPEGCGVFSGHNKSNAGKSKLKEGIVPVQSDVPGLTALSDHSENECSGAEGLDNSNDVATKDILILESNGSVKDHQEKEVIGEGEDKQNETSLVKKRRLSLHNSTVEIKTDVVNTSKRSIVLGLAAQSKCPWRQPKNRGSRRM